MGTQFASMILISHAQNIDVIHINRISSLFRLKTFVLNVHPNFVLNYDSRNELYKSVYTVRDYIDERDILECDILEHLWGYNGIGTFKLPKTVSEKQESNIQTPTEPVQIEKPESNIQTPIEQVQVCFQNDKSLNLDIIFSYLDCIWTNDQSIVIINNLKKNLCDLYYKKEHISKLDLLKSDDRIKNMLDGIQEILKKKLDSNLSIIALKEFLLDFGLKTHF